MKALKVTILATAILGADLSAISAYAAPVETTDSCTREEERANKQVVLDSFGGGLDSFLKGIAPDYDQHSPEFRRFGELNGVKGAAVFPVMGEAFQLSGQGGMPKPPPGQPPSNNKYMVLAQCDLVTIVAEGYEPDPQNPGKFYNVYRFDVFRVRNGKLAAHWDGGKIPDPVPVYLTKSVAELRAEKAKAAPSAK